MIIVSNVWPCFTQVLFMELTRVKKEKMRKDKNDKRKIFIFGYKCKSIVLQVQWGTKVKIGTMWVQWATN